MNKKITMICSLIIISILCVISVIYIKTTSKVALSKNEIEDLRKIYPINDNYSDVVDGREVSFEEYMEYCNSYIKAEIISGPITYVKKLSLNPNTAESIVNEKAGGLSEATFVKYEVRIIDDIWGNLKQDSIYITYNSVFDIGMPPMEKGSKFIIGGAYNRKTGMLGVNGDIMFYITEDDYILSVKTEKSKSKYSGYKADDFVDYIKKMKK